MARSSSHSGSNTPYAAGQQNYGYDVLFDHSSTSPYSHIFDVVENFVRIAAFNLSVGNTLTIEQVTGQGAGDSFADYCPVSGPATLYYTSATDQRTSYVLERPGRYRVRLDGPGLGLITVFQINFFMENEASQDIADALFAVLKGIKPTPCSIGQMIPVDVAQPNVIGKNFQGCLINFPLLSSDPGNLISQRPNGLYYGISPPPNFANQYVSSSTGNDDNPGTRLSPLKTIQRALANLPDGTQGNVYLLAGDTFHTYPSTTLEVINTLTYLESAAQIMQIGNRIVNFTPYNDPAIDTIQAYNAANGTVYNPFVTAETNFPTISVTVSIPTDIPRAIALGFNIGQNGGLTFSAVNILVGQTGTVAPAVDIGAITGDGSVFMQGGHVTISNVPMVGVGAGAGTQAFTFLLVQMRDHAVPSTPPVYSFLGQKYLYTTQAPTPAGTPYVLGFTSNGGNVEDFLIPASLWIGIVIYSTAYRSFKNIITSIPIA